LKALDGYFEWNSKNYHMWRLNDPNKGYRQSKHCRGNLYMGVLSQILSLLHKFEIFSLFHIKRDLNTIANQQAKEGSFLRKGKLKINGDLIPLPIP
jgi:hypothetical protein